ncbi:hypothetical protein ACVILH_002949 [Bradyrhizobium sp. USDA 4353]
MRHRQATSAAAYGSRIGAATRLARHGLSGTTAESTAASVDDREGKPLSHLKQHGDVRPWPRGAWRPSAASACPSDPRQRAQGRPGAGRNPWPPCVRKGTGQEPQVRPVHSGLPCAMVGTVSFVLSLGIGLFCPHRPRVPPSNNADLTSASRGQDHTTSPSALAPVVHRCRYGHRIPAPTFVTTRTPLCDEAGCAQYC